MTRSKVKNYCLLHCTKRLTSSAWGCCIASRIGINFRLHQGQVWNIMECAYRGGWCVLNKVNLSTGFQWLQTLLLRATANFVFNHCINITPHSCNTKSSHFRLHLCAQSNRMILFCNKTHNLCATMLGDAGINQHEHVDQMWLGKVF